MHKTTLLIARVLLALLYLVVGFYLHLYQSLTNPAFYTSFQQYIGNFGLHPLFAPLMMLIEIGGGVMLLIGYKIRTAALMLAGYSLFVGLMFHHHIQNQQELLILAQYLAITGGMLATAMQHYRR